MPLIETPHSLGLDFKLIRDLSISIFIPLPRSTNLPVTVRISGRRLRRERFTAVAPSGQQQSSLSRRKPPSSSSSSSSSPNQTLTSGRTRFVYRESLNSLSESDLNFPFWQRTWFILLLLVMALSFFGLAIFLFLSLDSDYSFNSPVSAASSSHSQGVEVAFFLLHKLVYWWYSIFWGFIGIVHSKGFLIAPQAVYIVRWFNGCL